MFESLPASAPDPLIGTQIEFDADPSSDKVNLGVGVYRDESGAAPVLNCVRMAERRLVEAQTTKVYLTPFGSEAYNTRAARLVLGEGLARELGGRVVAAQAVGGTGALRLAADVVSETGGPRRIWLPDPTWVNHERLFRAAGYDVRLYPYYDRRRGAATPEPMLAALSAATRGDLVLLQACCHNPTGLDPDADTWAAVREGIARTGATALVDFAYLGWAEGVDQDPLPLRRLVQDLPNVLVSVSFSKSFALYRERVGLLITSHESTAIADRVRGTLFQIVRRYYSSPSDHGAAVVAEILGDPELGALWRSELDASRGRLTNLRRRFAEQLSRYAGAPQPQIDAGRGLFTLVDLDRDATEALRRRHHVYVPLGGRINLAALNAANSDRVAELVAQVLEPSA